MKRIHLGLLVWLAFGPAFAGALLAQDDPINQPLEAAADPSSVTNTQTEAKPVGAPHRSGSEQFRIGGDLSLKEDQVAHEAVVIAGNANIAGIVNQDAVVVGGNATIDGTVKGDLVVVLGSVKLGPKAEIKRDLVVVLGSLDADPAAKVGGERIVIGLDSKWAESRWFKWPSQWFSHGLLLARPLPHQFLWSWVVAAVFLSFYVLLALLFPKPVQATVESLDAKPGSSLLVGLLALLLFGPMMLLLIATGVGVVIVPFLICAMIAAFIFGKVAVYRYAGQQLGGQIGLEILQRPLIALIIGVLIFYLLYVIPILGFVVWGAMAPLGIGAVLLALFRRYRAETAKANGAITPGAAVPPMTPSSSTPTGSDVALMPRAGFWLRVGATVLDGILIGLVSGLVFRHRPGLFLPLWVIYHIGMWGWKGTTIGGIVCNLKIVRTDGSPMNFAVAVVRSLASFLSAAVLFLGFCWAGWSVEKQAWHDKIAGTHIVRLPKGTPLL